MSTDPTRTALVTNGGPLSRDASGADIAFVELRFPDGRLSLRVGPFTPTAAGHHRDVANQHPEPVQYLNAVEAKTHPRRERMQSTEVRARLRDCDDDLIRRYFTTDRHA